MPGLGLSSRAIIGRFYSTLEKALDNSWVPLIGGVPFKSDQESETYRFLGMTPAMREWVGGRQPKGLRSNGLTIANKKFEVSLEVACADLRRDKTDQLKIRIDELADSAAQHWEELATTLLMNGTGTDSGLAYDGQSYFDTDHSEGSSGTQTNDLVYTDVPSLAVVDSSHPTQQEMGKAILGVIAHMFSFKDDQARPANSAAREFMVMVPIALWPAALAVATQPHLEAAAGHSVANPIAGAGFKLRVCPNARATWTTQFGVFRTDGRTKPIILQEEEPIIMDAIAEGSEEEFKNDRHLYGVKATRNVGYGNHLHACYAALSDA